MRHIINKVARNSDSCWCDSACLPSRCGRNIEEVKGLRSFVQSKSVVRDLFLFFFYSLVLLLIMERLLFGWWGDASGFMLVSLPLYFVLLFRFVCALFCVYMKCYLSDDSFCSECWTSQCTFFVPFLSKFQLLFHYYFYCYYYFHCYINDYICY